MLSSIPASFVQVCYCRFSKLLCPLVSELLPETTTQVYPGSRSKLINWNVNVCRIGRK